jgi:hypothetical protein
MAPTALRRGSQSIARGGCHRAGSTAEEQAEAHVPTLKGLGKSDCEVKIVSILECESLVPVDVLHDHSSSMLTSAELLFFITLMSVRFGCHCYATSPRGRTLALTESSRRQSLLLGRLTRSASTEGIAKASACISINSRHLSSFKSPFTIEFASTIR